MRQVNIRELYPEDQATGFEVGKQREPIDRPIVGDLGTRKLGDRRGRLVEMHNPGHGRVRLAFRIPSRGLIGFRSEFLTDTRGTGVLNRVFHGWAPHKGPIPGRRAGVLISMETGQSVAYALWGLEDRGRMFIGAQEQVYEGMIIGEHSRDNDLEVNPLKGKQLTNVRASGTDEAVRLTTPITLTLEQAIAYIDDDELVDAGIRAADLRQVGAPSSARKGGV